MLPAYISTSAVYALSLLGFGLWQNVAFNHVVLVFSTTLPFVCLFTRRITKNWFVKTSNQVKNSTKKISAKNDDSVKVVLKEEGLDSGRRQFLRLAGSLGVGAVFFSLLRRDANALQFGGTGVPDPIGVEPLGNSQTTSSVTLTDADTWYQVPSSNQASRVFLLLQNRSGYDMYWTFDNSVNASTGGLLFPTGATLQLDAGAAVNVYARCGTAAQVVWYAESQSQ